MAGPPGKKREKNPNKILEKVAAFILGAASLYAIYGSGKKFK